MLATEAVKEARPGSGQVRQDPDRAGRACGRRQRQKGRRHHGEVLNKDPAIKVVSNQAANWDANTALNTTATVIQQHPDLCASVGFWGHRQESGAAQAIRNAGKIDDVKVYASGEGSQLDCDQVNQGNFYRFLSYKATEQGHDLKCSPPKRCWNPVTSRGPVHLEYYTRPVWLDKANASGANCFAMPREVAARHQVPARGLAGQHNFRLVLLRHKRLYPLRSCGACASSASRRTRPPAGPHGAPRRRKGASSP